MTEERIRSLTRGAVFGAPAGAQRSGSRGESRSSGRSEPSPLAEARDLELVTATRHPSRSKKLKDFLN